MNEVNKIPLVSIIIATYRRDAELIRALKSITNSTYLNCEIIVVNDNADPIWNMKVKHIVEKFQNENSSMVVKFIVNHTNLGSAMTRNVGIESAVGEYICFLDDDDVYLPNRIANQLKAMMEQNVDYSITDLKLYGESNKLVDIRKRNYIKETTCEKLFQYHLMYHMTGTDTLMFRKSYIDKIGRFDSIDLGDEFYLMSKAILGGGKFLYVPTCDVKAYVHYAGGGLSSGKTKIEGENRLYEYKKSYFNLLDEKTRKYIKVRHHLVLGYAYAKDKKWWKFMKESVKAVFTDCKACFIVIFNRKKYV